MRSGFLLVLSTICLVLVGCGGSSSTGSIASASPTLTVSLTSSFTVTVLQGPAKGKALDGTPTFTRKANGSFTGMFTESKSNLVAAGSTLPVTGQLNGHLIGVYIHLGVNQNLFCTGVVSYDPDLKNYVLGGTFAGPSDTSTGAWEGEGDPEQMTTFGKVIGQD